MHRVAIPLILLSVWQVDLAQSQDSFLGYRDSLPYFYSADGDSLYSPEASEAMVGREGMRPAFINDSVVVYLSISPEASTVVISARNAQEEALVLPSKVSPWSRVLIDRSLKIIVYEQANYGTVLLRTDSAGATGEAEVIEGYSPFMVGDWLYTAVPTEGAQVNIVGRDLARDGRPEIVARDMWDHQWTIASDHSILVGQTPIDGQFKPVQVDIRRGSVKQLTFPVPDGAQVYYSIRKQAFFFYLTRASKHIAKLQVH